MTSQPLIHSVGRARGFTLVEILIVVMIIGILAAIVIPQFVGASEEVRHGAFINDIRVFTDAASLYHHDNGSYLENSDSGVLPQGLEYYVPLHKWDRGTPIGGKWDHEADTYDIKSAIGVHFDGDDKQDDPFMLNLDRRMDDNNLSTGSFRKLDTDRYYRIVAQ